MHFDFGNRDLYNETYIPLLYCTKRYVFLMGGGGSGKSRFQAQKEIIKTFEKGTRLLGIRKVKDTIKDSMFAELCSVISDWGLGSYFEITRSPMHIINKETGSDVIFRGLDDPEKIKSVTAVTRAWVEEATELEKKDFDQLDLRLRGRKDLQISLTFNPISDEHWINTDFWQHGNTRDVELKRTTYLDNRFVGDQYAKVMERLKEQDPRMYAIYALGEWGKAVEGLIFNYEDIDCVPDGARFIAYGQDFGYTNDPSAFIGVYEYNNEIILDEVFYRPGLTNQDIANLYKSEGVRFTDRIWGDSSEPKSIDEIHRYGYDIDAVTKGPDSVMFGINLMLQRKIRITNRSTNLKKEFRNYVWRKDKSGKKLNAPIDAFNHAIDAVRYVFLMELRIEEEDNDTLFFIKSR